MSKWSTPGYVHSSPCGARRAAAIAGPGRATRSASPTQTSHGQCRPRACRTGRNGRPSSQRDETRSRQRESSPVATTRRQPVLGVRRVDERRLARSADGRKVRAAERRGEHPRGHRAARTRCAWRTMSRNGTWRDRRRHARVAGRRGERVAAAHRRSEGDDPLRVGAVERACVRDRRAPVLELARRLEQVRLAAAVTEAAVVEDEREQPRRREALGERAEAVAACPGQPVGHHHHRRRPLLRGRPEQPRRALLAARHERDLGSIHALSNDAPARKVRSHRKLGLS